MSCSTRARASCCSLALLCQPAGGLVVVPRSLRRLSPPLHTLPPSEATYATAPTDLPSCFKHATARCFREPELSTADRRRRNGSRRGLGTLRATVASWPAVQGAEGEGGGGGERTVVGEVSGSPQRSVDGVVLMEQEGPAWTEIVWDEEKERFVGANSLLDMSNSQKMKGAVGGLQLLVRHWFIPEDVTPDYYHFTLWRMFQRFVAGTVNVFGTQALLLALGIKSRRLGAAAAMSWVLKDALGKFGRILWASKMGRRFDSDAKRWRFRSSLLYAAGNGLEIVTYVFPASFLILAAAANSFKQMSMLTSSATRNTIYRSFARGENIGDITAKGEAQIAVVDLLGMLSGIGLCTLVGTSRHAIVAAYILLSLIDIQAIYNEIRAVVFTVLNHERTHLLARDYVASGSDPAAMAQKPVVDRSSSAKTEARPKDSGGEHGDNNAVPVAKEARYAVADTPPVSPGGDGPDAGLLTVPVAAVAGGVEGARGEGADTSARSSAKGEDVVIDTVRAALASEKPGTALLSSPSTVSKRENIFLASRLTTNAFKTWSQAGVSMGGVSDLLRIFGKERYMLAYTEGGKRNKLGAKTTGKRKARGTVSVILHKEATGADTVQSLLALEYFHEELANAGFAVVGASPSMSRQQNSVKPSVNGSLGVSREGVAVERWGKELQAEGAGEAPSPEEALSRERGGGGGTRSGNPSPEELRRCLEAARRRASEGAPGFFAALGALGWSTEKFMFGNIKSRVEWRL